MKLFGGLAAIPMSIASLVVNGLVTADLWNWFVSPLGIVTISTAHAIGLRLTVGVFRIKTSDTVHNKEEDKDKKIPSWLKSTGMILAALWCWLIAAVVGIFSGHGPWA